MKARTAIGRTALRARLTAAGCGALTVLGIATLSACSGSGSPSSPAVSSFTIAGASTSAGRTSSPGITAHVTTPGIISGETTSGESTPATHAPSPTVTVTHTVTHTATPAQASTQIPSGAPVTGGGGTAGFQGGLLLAVGAAAIVAGAGSIAYRRRLTRNR
ncbi:MAG TPA: hypothetical protein VIY52_03840 [Streptosporangiaceae bacterium]